LKGRGDDPPVPYRPVAEALEGVLHDEGPGEKALAAAAPVALADLARLCPALRELRSGIPAAEPLNDAPGRQRLFDPLPDFLASLRDCGPLILFLAAPPRADPDPLSLLPYATDRLAGRPVWVLAACQSGEEGAVRGLLNGPAGPRGSEIRLGLLPA